MLPERSCSRAHAGEGEVEEWKELEEVRVRLRLCVQAEGGVRKAWSVWMTGRSKSKTNDTRYLEIEAWGIGIESK